MYCLCLALAWGMISTQGLLSQPTIDPNSRNLGRIPWHSGDAIREQQAKNTITIINNSDQLIKARCNNGGAFGSEGEFQIRPYGGVERWSRVGNTICRICAYSSWHDFVLEPASFVTLTPDFKILKNGNQIADARIDGPHI